MRQGASSGALRRAIALPTAAWHSQRRFLYHYRSSSSGSSGRRPPSSATSPPPSPSPQTSTPAVPAERSPSPILRSLSQETLRDDSAFGLFQNTHINAFPIRAAIDIGTSGVISLCIGRVDADKAAITKLMYATQLPLYLEAAHAESHEGSVSSTSFQLSEKTMVDIRNKMRVLTGVMRRDAYEGLSERAAVLSHPLCLAENAVTFAEELTKEFKVKVLVLGKSFEVSWPGVLHPLEQREYGGSPTAGSSTDGAGKDASAFPQEEGKRTRRGRGRRGPLKRLMRAQAAPHGGGSAEEAAEVSSSSSALSTAEQLEQLAFLAHAAAAQCVAPQRMLVLVEDAQKGLTVVGTDTTAAFEVQDLLVGSGKDGASGGTVSVDPADRRRILKKAGLLAPSSDDAAARTEAVPMGGGEEGAAHPLVPRPSSSTDGRIRLLKHRLPVDVAEAHRRCILDIQRRPIEGYHLHGSSPNPLLKEEWVALRNLIGELTAPTLPEWVKRKAELGGVIAATSFNGGLWNIAARVAQRAPVSLEHLEVNAQFHFCGLTDVLLASTFPNPLLVLPSAALAAALLRALHSPRVSYLPELSVAVALLVQPVLWTHHNARRLRSDLRASAFFADVKQRTFHRPHIKNHPTAPPDAEWMKDGRWNDLSFRNSMRGT